MNGHETPLMRQYNQIKKQYPDTILLFRMGDFFETFDEDAVLASKACGITLTKRHNGGAGESPLAGFPHHQLDNYLPKLVKAGYRVAVCEQLEDPKLARGIVKRGVVEVVTPGVALYDKLLNTKTNNYVASIYIFSSKTSRIAGISFCDVSTGEFSVMKINPLKINEALLTINPAEILISKEQQTEIIPYLKDLAHPPAITKLEEWMFDAEFTKEKLLTHFGTLNLKGFGIDNEPALIAASGAVLNYISETRKDELKYIRAISVTNPTNYMALDSATRRNLEILFSMHDMKNASLIEILDRTETNMGSRLFKKWISAPLNNINEINFRRNAVDAIYSRDDLREELRFHFQEVGDLERLISKIAAKKANPRDIRNLASGLRKIPKIKLLLMRLESSTLHSINSRLEEVLDIIQFIDTAFEDEPTTSLGSGNVFKTGYNSELDSFVEAKKHGKSWINNYQEEEREKTGIPILKVSFNNVFGYYIDITNTHKNKVPEQYQRRQTLANSERYITDELKVFESKILGAEENISRIEKELFEFSLNKIASQTIRIQEASQLIATIDCLQSFAQVSKENNYTPAIIDESCDLFLDEARHPIVEKLLPSGTSFTPNSTFLDTKDNQIHIITGPNMSGKSCYLRQVALSVFLGQIGCYVPAKQAKFGIVDRIFTRLGAQDNISSGESTFLIEMQETANIINNSTERSLILLDEVGRGTATTDGISIAWAIAEYLHNVIKAKTLFATHYHELNKLSEIYNGIKNFRIDVIGKGSDLVFTHNVREGGSDKSFGIHVAKMAGLPFDLINRADEIMLSLEGQDNELVKKQDTSKIKKQKSKYETSEGQLAIFEIRDDNIRDRIKKMKPDEMTPIQALQYLMELYNETVKN